MLNETDFLHYDNPLMFRCLCSTSRPAYVWDFIGVYRLRYELAITYLAGQFGDDAGCIPFNTVALDITPHMEFMATFRILMWGAMAVAVGVMALLGWLVARSGLRPLREVVSTI
ncbi:MAG: hypothetical protein HW388_798, partial [Dehalococcoidia bacterium]|nr:hypothetical protein [Dehalococcoidia bacterium]